jgi:hypothetical protein
MSTPREIIDAAYGTSKLNQPGSSASETGELLPLLNRILRGLFAEGARVNRKIFATRATVAWTTDSWPRPTGAEMILRIEAGAGMASGAGAIAAGTEIVEVPFDQRRAEPGKPAIYALGQKYYPAGGPNDPTGAGSLVFFYSSRPVALTSLTQTIDPLWPDQFDSLLILEMARYLAAKDGGEKRAQETQVFISEYEREHARFVAWLEHESTVEVKSWGHFNRINPPGIQVG